MSPALAQMMSRYAMRGTVTSSMLVAISSDPGLVRAAVSLLAAGMIGVQLLNHDGCRSPQVQSLMAAQGADGACSLLAAAAPVLFVAAVPKRRQRAPNLTCDPWRATGPAPGVPTAG